MQTYANHRSKQTRNPEKHTSEHGSIFLGNYGSRYSLEFFMVKTNILITLGRVALPTITYPQIQEGVRALLHVFWACALEVIKRSEWSEFSCVFWHLERAKTRWIKHQKQLIQSEHPHWQEETHTPTWRTKKMESSLWLICIIWIMWIWHVRAKSPKRIPHSQTTDNHGIRYISYCPIRQLDMCDICGLDGFWVFVPSTSVSVQVQRMQREARNTQLCHQAGVALSKSGGRGHTAKFLRALVDKVFLGSTRKFSQTSWGNHSWGMPLFSKRVGRVAHG